MFPRPVLRQSVWLLVLVLGPLGRAESTPPAGLFHPEAGRPVIRDFRPTEYRGHPQVFGLSHGPRQFLYFANQEGIIEFDGARWTHHAMPSAQVYETATGPDGRIWAGGNDELGYFTKEAGGKLTYHSIRAQLPPEAKPWDRTTGLLIHQGVVHFACPRGFLRITGDRLEFFPITKDRRATLHLIGNEVVGHVTREGLYSFGQGKLVPIPGMEAIAVLGRMVSTVMADGRTLFCLQPAGAFIFDPATRQLAPFPGPVNDTTRAIRINDLLTLADGTVAVASAGQGLLLVSRDLKSFRRIDRTSGLADNSIISLAADHEGGLWLGYNSGLARLSFASNVTVFDATNGPTPGTIDSWGRHRDRLYAGTYDGLYRLEPPDDAARGARFVRINEQVAHIFGIESYQDQLLVLAGTGLHRVDPDTARHELLVPSGNNSGYVLVRSARIPGRFYIGGATGLTVVQHDATGWHKVGERLDLGDVHTATLEPDGTLWLATYNRGFWRVPGAEAVTDWSQAAFEQYHRGHGLPDKIVWTTVTPGHAGTVFFTDKGGRRFDAARKVFVPEDRYVFDDGVAPMLTPTVTSGADTWGSAFRESTLIATPPLGRFTPGAGGKFIWETASPEALQEIGFGGAAVMWVERTPQGSVFWARGYNNTVRLDLAAPQAAAAAWPVHVRALAAEGHAQGLPADPAQALKLAYSREPIVFDLAAPHFGALDGLKYQTRLVGFSDTWSEPADTPRFTYTNLEGGPFTFEARAIDSTGSVSAVAQLHFSVSPPWPRSASAFAVYGLLALGAVSAGVRWRLRAAERERQRLETLVTQRTGELAVARDDAQAANRAKSTFLAHMSHELRTPLNGVIGYAQVLLNDRTLAGTQRERAQIVHASGEHLLRLINEVLDFSKIEAGRTERNDALFVPVLLLRELATLHASAAATKGLRFATDLPANPDLRVTGDAQKLRQVLDNLLGNAIKFTRTGSVTLEAATTPDGAWRFAVRDTGVGLSAEDLAQLFQPFTQATHRPDAGGTGLGLVITQRLVRLLGGELQVESEPGRGSCFHFTLPLPPASGSVAPFPPAGEITDYAGPRRRLLIVDDHEANRRLVADLLTPLGFACATVASAEEALASPALATADLVLSDVRLPGMNGIELARRLHASRPALPVILSSASVLTFDHAAARAAGVPDFLPKPFAAAQLHDLLGRLLGLDWQRTTPTPAAPGAALPRNTRRQLAELADSGDITAFRSALRDLRASLPACAMTLDELDNLAAGYQLERLRQALRDTTA